MKRSHKVFVRDIGPTFSFANADRAHARARALTDGSGIDTYAEVIVYDGDISAPLERTVYRYDREPRVERFKNGRWS